MQGLRAFRVGSLVFRECKTPPRLGVAAPCRKSVKRTLAVPPSSSDDKGRDKARRLFGGHGDRPRIETRPRSSTPYRRAGQATEAGFGENRRRCFLCLKPSDFAGLRHQVPCAEGTVQGKSTVVGRRVRPAWAATLCASVASEAKQPQRFRAWDAPAGGRVARDSCWRYPSLAVGQDGGPRRSSKLCRQTPRAASVLRRLFHPVSADGTSSQLRPWQSAAARSSQCDPPSGCPPH
jgi:hypothetical protein